MTPFLGVFLVFVLIGFLLLVFNLSDQELNEEGKKYQRDLAQFLQQLLDQSADPSKLAEGLGLLKRADYEFSRSQEIYGLALKFLEVNPANIAAKVFALEVGRWSLSLGREDGKITIYDEAALQNDIQVRSR
jgi:hypothetical protein